jgi:hypothetical protein
MIRLGDHLFHPFHILGLRLEQTAEVMFHGGFYRSSSTAEMATETITKAKQPLPNPRQQPHIAVGSSCFNYLQSSTYHVLPCSALYFDKACIILTYS